MLHDFRIRLFHAQSSQISESVPKCIAQIRMGFDRNRTLDNRPECLVFQHASHAAGDATFYQNGSVCGSSLVRSEKNFGFFGQKFHGGWDMISYESQGQRSIHFLANCSHLRMICPLLALSVWKFALKLQAPAG
jgi:hypothetical protein